MEHVRVRVRLFGPFRKYSNGSGVAFDVPRGTTVSKLRRHLLDALRRASPGFSGDDLLSVSVLADESQILAEDQAIGAGVGELSLAVLPPVCGG